MRADFIRKEGELFDTDIEFREDSHFLCQNFNQGAKYLLVKDPRYIMNMRKLEKWGYLKEVYRYLKLVFLQQVIKKSKKELKYASGGEWY